MKFYKSNITTLFALLVSTSLIAQGPGNVTTNLDLWLKSNTGTSTTTDGVDLTQWSDQSSGANHATEATNSPVYRNNSTDNVNFYPAVDFNGSDDQLTGTAGFHNDEISLIISPDNTINSSASAEYPLGWNASTATDPTQSGLGIGVTDGTLTDEVITYYIGSAQYRRAYTDNSVSYSTPILINLTENGSLEEIRIDHQQLDDAETGTFLGFTDEPYTIGSRHDLSNYFDGTISEVISYSSSASSTERNRIASYLALKYGITLNQSSATDYTASDGTTEIWDKDATDASTYDNDITGIGRDSNSALSQPEAKSANSDAILTITGDGEGTNISPSLSDITNLEFLTWGNDDGAASWTPTDAPATYQILSRQWSVQETGDVGAITVSFDVQDGDFDVPDKLSGTNYYLVIDTDDDGNLNDETPVLLYDDGTNGDTSASDNVWSLQGVDFDSGEDFTIATSEVGPGGLTTNLTVWFKSDVGTSTTTDGAALSQWDDQSGDDNHATESTNQPDYRNNTTDNINSNPVIDFNSTNTDLLTGTAGFYTDEYFVILDPDNTINSSATAEYPLGWNATSVTDPTQSGLGLGVTDGTLTDEVITHYIGSALYRRGYTDNSISYTTAMLINSSENSGVTLQEIRVNNELLDDQDNSGSFASYSDEPFTIGSRHDQSNYFDGKIAEVISFSSRQSAINRQKIESYLAIKYGLTTTQDNDGDASTLESPNGDGINEGDYVSSSGTVSWDASANSSYHTDIAGVGRDDNSDLDQRSSQSVNSSTAVLIANGDIASPSAFSADDSFLIWGHDGSANTFGSGNFTNADGTTSNRMTRVWKVDETGTVGSVEISFDNTLATGTVSIVSHPSDASFPADALRRVVEMTDSGTDYEGTIDLDDGAFFSFVNASASAIGTKPVLINEVITDPQQDWSGGNFFDAQSRRVSRCK